VGRTSLFAESRYGGRERLPNRPVPTLQFKGKTVIETYHHTVPHHGLELVPELSVLDKGQKPGLDGNLIIEGDNLLALKALLPTHAGRVKCWPGGWQRRGGFRVELHRKRVHLSTIAGVLHPWN